MNKKQLALVTGDFAAACRPLWGGQSGSNRRPPGSQPGALPLSYTHTTGAWRPGAAKWPRTTDACAFNAALYQLSYRGIQLVAKGLVVPWRYWRFVRGSNPRLHPGQGCTLATELTNHRMHGGGDRHRTCDGLLAKQVLFRLSYTPVICRASWRIVSDSNARAGVVCADISLSRGAPSTSRATILMENFNVSGYEFRRRPIFASGFRHSTPGGAQDSLSGCESGGRTRDLQGMNLASYRTALPRNDAFNLRVAGGVAYGARTRLTSLKGW